MATLNELFDSFEYAHFVTLTYSDKFLPCLRFVRYSKVSNPADTSSHLDEVSPLHKSFSDYDRAHFKFDFEPSDSFVREALNHHHQIPAYLLPPVFERLDNHSLHRLPVLNIRDVQLFLKRLRKTIKTEIDEKPWLQDSENPSSSATKLSYALVGEYGPVHFRPHYHLILFTSNRFVSELLPRLVPEVWKNGYTHTQLAGRGSASYIAGYFNSFSTLPGFYTKSFRNFKPFFRTSRLDDISFPGGTLFENDADSQFDSPCRSAGEEFVQSERSRQTFVRLLSKLEPLFRLDGLRSCRLFESISATWRFFGYDRWYRQCEKGSLKPALFNYLYNLPFSVRFSGRRNGRPEVYVRLLRADQANPEFSLLNTFVDILNIPVGRYVEKSLILNSIYLFVLNLNKLFRYFGLSLYSFSRSTFRVFWLKLKVLRTRLLGSKISNYFRRIEQIDSYCKDNGYSEYDTLMACLSPLHLLHDFHGFLHERKKTTVFNNLIKGFLDKHRYLSFFEKDYLSFLKERAIKQIKHKELNDRLIFTSQYLDSYDYVVI